MIAQGTAFYAQLERALDDLQRRVSDLAGARAIERSELIEIIQAEAHARRESAERSSASHNDPNAIEEHPDALDAYDAQHCNAQSASERPSSAAAEEPRASTASTAAAPPTLPRAPQYVPEVPRVAPPPVTPPATSDGASTRLSAEASGAALIGQPRAHEPSVGLPSSALPPPAPPPPAQLGTGHHKGANARRVRFIDDAIDDDAGRSSPTANNRHVGADAGAGGSMGSTEGGYPSEEEQLAWALSQSSLAIAEANPTESLAASVGDRWSHTIPDSAPSQASAFAVASDPLYRQPPPLRPPNN